MILTGKVFIDGQRVVDAGYRLSRPEALTIDWPRQSKQNVSFRRRHGLHDDALIVIDKPAGLLSTPTADEERETALHAARRLCRGGVPTCRTSIRQGDLGTDDFCSRSKSARNLRRLIDHKDVQRTYRCIVHGCPSFAEATISSALLRDAGGGRRGSRAHSFQVVEGLHIVPNRPPSMANGPSLDIAWSSMGPTARSSVCSKLDGPTKFEFISQNLVIPLRVSVSMLDPKTKPDRHYTRRP